MRQNGQFKTSRVIVFQEIWNNDDQVIDQVFQGNKDALFLFMAEELTYKNIRDMDFESEEDEVGINWDSLETTNTNYLCEKFKLNTLEKFEEEKDILFSEEDYKKVLKIYEYLISEIEKEFNAKLIDEYRFAYQGNGFYNERLEWLFGNYLFIKY